jgi:LysM repeat protein/ABC-type branched-subunit amino acid transport system substrate-binding protein
MNTSTLMKYRMNLPVALLLFFAVMITSCASRAQVVSNKVEDVNGVKYYIHTVEKGQTLYALSKLYQIDVNEITAANPGSDQGIKEGAVLRIPVAKAKAVPSTPTVPVVPAPTPTTAPTATAPSTEYTTHEVQRKETLYSISKQYNIDINDLVAANPGSDAGVKKGQVLRIPIKKVTPEPVVPSATSIKHIVAPGETLYGIARKYGVTVESIQQANGGLELGLRANQELIIPGVDPVKQNETAGTFPDNTSSTVIIPGEHIKEKYNIGLMLPFYTHYTDTMESREKMLREVALQMYRGALMAADTLEAHGLRANIFTYDVLDGKSSITGVLEKPEMQQMDVVIGPTFRDALNDATIWGAKNGVHFVCPVQQTNKVLLNSSNMSKSVASSATQWITVARHIYKTSPKENIIIIDSKNIDDRRSIDAFREEWKRLSGDSLKNIIVVNDASNFTVQEMYSALNKNIIIAPTSDKKLISTLFRVLGEGNIVVYGNESWDNMEIISVANRNKYNVHFPQTSFVDYNSYRVQRWIENYRKRFKSEPSEYAFLGFDLMMYYGSGLQQFGRNFPNHFNEIKAQHLYAHGFDFIKTGQESGFENQYVSIICTKDFVLVKEN